MTRHDLENSLITIIQLSKSVAPVLEKMIQHINAEKAYYVASEKQLCILSRSMQTMIIEAEKLRNIVLSNKGTKNDDEVD